MSANEIRPATSAEVDTIDLIIETSLLSFGVDHDVSRYRGRLLRALSNGGFIVAKDIRDE